MKIIKKAIHGSKYVSEPVKVRDKVYRQVHHEIQHTVRDAVGVWGTGVGDVYAKVHGHIQYENT